MIERIRDSIYNITYPVRVLICRIRGHRQGDTYPVVEPGGFLADGTFSTGPVIGHLWFCKVCSHVESDVPDDEIVRSLTENQP